MKIMKTLAFASVACLLLAACATAPAPAAFANDRSLVLGADATPPNGFLAMCAAKPELCVVPADARSKVAATDTMATLVAVNRRVNASVRQKSDYDVYGLADVWSRPVRSAAGLTGDCKKIALEKRLELIEAGVPAQSLTYALVYRRDLGLHIVLVAATENGDMVLDSRTPYVTRWQEAPYAW